jgi:hypothetical protein
MRHRGTETRPLANLRPQLLVRGDQGPVSIHRLVGLLPESGLGIPAAGLNALEGTAGGERRDSKLLLRQSGCLTQITQPTTESRTRCP